MQIKELLSNENNFKNAVQYLLSKKYEEYKIIDTLKRYPEKLSFEDWLINILEEC